MISEFNKRKKDAIAAAKDLLYGEPVVNELKEAKTEVDIEKIMRAARKEKFG